MKALILAREGKKAILLLPGGEMRTVRALKDWQTGMEVSVKPYPLRKTKKRMNPRAVFYPLAACAAAFLIVFAGLNRLGGEHVDHQHPVQPLSSGIPAVTEADTPEPTAEPTPKPTASAVPQPTPTAEPDPTAAQTGTAVQMAQPTPQPKAEICDECGGYGHDDDDCPEQICDECGQKGHDDDHCPNERCDECGEYGHDDDDCPEQICDECGQKGHDDDHCPQKHNGRHHDD